MKRTQYPVLGAQPPSKRIARALEQTAKIHPSAPKFFRNAVTVAWENVAFTKGAFAIWEATANGEELYRSLLEPQASLYFAGEHASRITSWMAGAIESARSVVKKVHLRAAGH